MGESYEETNDSCDGTEFEKSKEMFAMLQWSARTLFNREWKEWKTFGEAVDVPRLWYYSEEKQGRLLS